MTNRIYSPAGALRRSECPGGPQFFGSLRQPRPCTPRPLHNHPPPPPVCQSDTIMSWVARGVGSLARWAGPRAPLHRAPGGAAGLHTAAVMMATVAQRLRLLNAHRDRKFRNNWKEMMGV